MPDDTTIKRFEKLLSEYLEGELDESGRREFVELLETEPSCSAILQEQLMMDARLAQFESQTDSANRFVDTLLATVAAETDGSAFVDHVMDYASLEKAEPKRLNIRFILAATVAAMAMLVIGLTIGNRTDDSKPASSGLTLDSEVTDDGVAVISHSDNVQWGEGSSARVGDILSPCTLKLDSGVLQLDFYSGARLLIEGPADLDLISTSEALCRQGRVRAFVPPPARGFRIVSPQFELVDLGTEFGIAIERDGEAKVQVFDGEVELYPPGRSENSQKARKLFGGDGLVYNNSVAGQDLASIDPATFPSFENIERRKQSGAEKRFKLWRNWNEKLLDDSRVAFSYDFETEGSQLIDRGPDSSNGTIIGAEWVGGRWPGKKALEFKRPSDRVRFDMPGSFDAMTVSVWLRLDALPNRSQGILLTDNYDPGRLHLALNPTGNLRMGIRTPTNSKRWKDGAAGYGTPELFTPRQIGVWSFVCSVYDRETGKVRMYFNGRQVADEDIIYDQPLEIGTCDLGNWTSTRGKVRNFVGRMDELTIWNSALSTEEIRQIYRRTRP